VIRGQPAGIGFEGSMKRLSTQAASILTGAVILVMSSGIARAADDGLLSAPEVTISSEPVSTGLYLRADVGIAAFRNDGSPDLLSGAQRYGFDDDRFDRPVSGALGVGYRVTDILRADVTAELFEGRFTGTTTDALAGSADIRADLRAVGLMANGYADLATVAGFTPYVGAGLGATYLEWHDVATTAAGGDLDGQDSWRFTYALMAGASYDLTERLKLDISYRYSDIADGTMFTGAGQKGRDDGLSRHELRAGLRFSLY
jgi:opacity protein-like surface antigen